MGSPEDNLLAKEIDSWKGFEYALRQRNATLFNKMLTECLGNEEYVVAFKTKGTQDSVESLFMALNISATEVDKKNKLNKKSIIH